MIRIFCLLPVVLAFVMGHVAGQNQQPAGTLADYIYTPPQGWTTTTYPDGIVISSPVSNTGEKCLLQVWPMRSPSGNLAQDAVAAFRQIFSAYTPKNSEFATRNSAIRGVSAQGWDYFIIKNAIQITGSNYQIMFGFVFVAGLGNRVAVISGISKDPLVSACFGLNLTDVWPKFFYSLRFKGWNTFASPKAMMQRIAGTWMGGGATAADRWVFAGNGRFASASAAQRYYAVGANEAIAVTDAYFGDGAWALDGQAIVLIKDNDRANPARGWIRVEQESYDNGNTWEDRLYLLRVSSVDGKEFEMGYRRER